MCSLHLKGKFTQIGEGATVELHAFRYKVIYLVRAFAGVGHC